MQSLRKIIAKLWKLVKRLKISPRSAPIAPKLPPNSANSASEITTITSSIFIPDKSNPHYYPTRIFDATPPDINIPTLQQLATKLETDEAITDAVLVYYDAHKSQLKTAWHEPHPTRLKAILTMYIIHISHPYGDDGRPYYTFAEYLRRSNSDCSLYALYQSRLLDQFGIKWRHVAISSADHGWIEVEIDGRWEIFDATINVWLNKSAFELLKGRPRQYRFFYTPWADINCPEARQYLIDENMLADDDQPIHSLGTLRSNMLGLGIYFFTEAYRQQSNTRLEIWRESE